MLQQILIRGKAANPYDRFLTIGRNFGNGVRVALEKEKKPDWSKKVFFGYDTGFLEPAQWIKAHGGRTIVGQMDPSRVEVDLVREEEGRWPGWAKRGVKVPEAYFQRREQEWAVADIVMVNSQWTKSALIRQGVPERKIKIVPLAFEEKVETGNLKPENQRAEMALDPRRSTPNASHSTENEPLRVLFLGQVNLRKGIQYLIEAARMLDPKELVFDIVGSIQIAEHAVAGAPPNVLFHGPVNRADASAYYRRADVFTLPTLSDGFAITQLEAMSYGLPVITTPNCGDVVTDGLDGQLVPARDAGALANAIRRYATEGGLLQAQRKAAFAKAGHFSLGLLERQLEEIWRSP